MRLFEFSLGMSSWVAWQKLSKRQLSFSAMTIIEVVSIVLTILWLSVGSEYAFRQAQTTLTYIPDMIVFWLRNVSSAWIFAILLISIASAKGAIGRFLSARIFVWLGEISFAVYMIHQILLKFFVIHYPQRTEASLFFLALIIVSACIHHFIEVPMRNILLLFGKQVKISALDITLRK
jgi:peptidoglycan/LPS O-acetylase OafA/YrhL